MSDADWNKKIRLYPTDHLFRAVFSPLIPKRVRPNHFTVLRLLLVAPTLALLAKEHYLPGFALFLFAALTDWFDGALARTRKQISEWGILYDPLVDKLLVGSALFLMVLQHLNFWLGVALLVVEGGAAVAALFHKRRGRIAPANIWGKGKMVAEVVGVLLLILGLFLKQPWLEQASAGTLILAFVLAIISIAYRFR